MAEITVCVCVCIWRVCGTDGRDCKRQKRTGVLFLLQLGPHVGALGESPLHDLHVFLEPPSYIEIIANVGLISPVSSAQSQGIVNRSNTGKGHGVYRPRKKKRILTYGFRIHRTK